MGETIVSMTIHGPRGSATVDALAATTATFSKISRTVADQVGLNTGYEVQVELGDGLVVTRQLAAADLEIDGVRGPAPVAIAEDGEQPLIGYTTLEILGFKVDPVEHRLEPRAAIEY